MKPIGEMSMGELAAFICTTLKENGINVVLSGGGCVSLYTEGQYVSYDLDFIENLATSRRKRLSVLESIGFEEDNRYFKHPDTDFFLEFPAGPLAVGEEPPQELVIHQFETGDLVTLSPTDCIKDRLAAYYHWDDRQCLEQALEVARSTTIDLKELERWSANEGHRDKLITFSSLLEDAK